MSALLELAGVSRAFGGLRALSSVDLAVQRGEVVGLIGPNGAGKTTLVNVVTGVHRATSGRVRFDGEDVTRLRPYQAARRGIARTFQIVQPFSAMTVLENVTAAALFGGAARSIAEARAQAREQLAFVGLEQAADRRAGALTLAMRKRLELAKGLAMRPKLLLLDEVNAGLNAVEMDAALALIRGIAARGVTIVIIEHLMKVVLSLCSRIVVLHHGELIAAGKPSEIVKDARVVQAYLGRRYAEAQPAHG
ncbi:MAG: ABC transporter ATP-binding protein [Betaproteobacteria bacterium]|nr:MAG: ABC transporter ATP-binding protein [Betaproteobacteria bacterium]